MRRSKRLNWFAGVLFISILCPQVIKGATVEELRSQISSYTAEIKKLEAEIVGYQQELKTTAQAATGLEGEINRLGTTRKKLAADIKATETKIDLTNLEIEKITLEIGRKSQTDVDRQQALAESLREWRDRDDESLFEIVLGYPQLADFWSELDQLSALQKQVQNNIQVLRSIKSELEVSKTETEGHRQELNQLRARLSDQKTLAEDNKAEKDRLLKLTKNKEANYKTLLSAAQAKKEAFEKELFSFEAELRIIIDPKSIPPAGKGILAWPLNEILVTQRFGKTVDAKRLYVSGTHNGVDFRATVGTPVKATLNGVIAAVGNTEQACPGASYGQWIIINHPHGLSPPYGHLPLAKS